MEHLSPSSTTKSRPQPLRLASDDSSSSWAEGLLVPASESKREMRLRPTAPKEVAALDLAEACSAICATSGEPSNGTPSRAIARPIRLEDTAMLSPPSTPPMRNDGDAFAKDMQSAQPAISYAHFDYDLDQGELLGSGLWSKVYKVQAQLSSPPPAAPLDLFTPPTTPQKNTHGISQIIAVKSATRTDAKEVFEEEARILSYIQTSASSSTYIIPFLGLSPQRDALLFHCASTTLHSWSTQYSSTSSVPELLTLYPQIVSQLTSGLAFLHAQSVIHADIKPANILLDLSPSSPPRARYADFSASLLSDFPPSTPSATSTPQLPDTPTSSAPVSRANSQKQNPGAGGGTYAFMAPEQLLSNPQLNAPSYASDVYALGVTLLTTLMGGENPFREVEGQNIFLLREAVKMGDAIGWCRRDAGLRVRVREIEGSAVGKASLEGVARATKKRAEERVGARAWAGIAAEVV